MFSRNILFKHFSPEIFLKTTRKFFYKNNILSLMYHEVLSDEVEIDAWTVVKESEFIKQMKYLKDHFEIISLNDAIQISQTNTKFIRNYVIITFDDGYLGNRETVFPIINDMNIPITIFVSTEAVIEKKYYWYDKIIRHVCTLDYAEINLKKYDLGTYVIDSEKSSANRWGQIEMLLEALKILAPKTRSDAVEDILLSNKMKNSNNNVLSSMSVEDIMDMSKCSLITFGAHSHCHNLLPQLDTQALIDSVVTSKNLLQNWTNKKIEHFAYPNGTYDKRTIEIIMASGFKSSQTVKSGLWKRQGSLFEIPRISVGRYDSFGFFKAKVSGVLI